MTFHGCDIARAPGEKVSGLQGPRGSVLQSFWRAHRATLVVLPRCMSWSHGLSVRAPETSAEALHHLVAAAPRLVVLTGAGCSTECGIPDYRDADGEWKRKQPVQYREFVDDEYARQRYWGRSMIGWLPFSRARPGRTHELLAQTRGAWPGASAGDPKRRWSASARRQPARNRPARLISRSSLPDLRGGHFQSRDASSFGGGQSPLDPRAGGYCSGR